jgi:trimeric autotransporter adhesin
MPQSLRFSAATRILWRAEFDQGLAPGSLPMQRMLLVLRRSPEQESSLQRLLDEQQDKASPNHHKWVTPDRFGKEFGLSDGDLETVTAWLKSCGFQITAVSKGRTAIEFSGSVSQVQQAFHTSIHKYLVNGESHWANAVDPSIPTALVPAVTGVLSLHNFPRHPQSTVRGTPLSTKPGQNAPLAGSGEG